MRFALASCSKIQKQPVQPAWEKIEREEPELLLMLGDNVYGGAITLTWKKYHRNLERRYQQLLDEKHFKHLTARVPFKAIWDDHDFARGDDAKGTRIKNRHKNRSRELFHRYMRSSNNLPEAYYAFEQGNARFIMLDVRYYREPAAKKATILGKQQEAWLENQLDHGKRYTVIGSGSCLTKNSERWSRYTRYYDRFCAMARERGNVLFVSGDIHKNRFVEHDGFHEVISSGVGRGKRDNYGIVDLQDEVAKIKLRGNDPKDNNDVLIDTQTWQVIGR